MGRLHKDVVVVIAYDADGKTLKEDIVPNKSFEVSGSILLNSAAVRAKENIRMISVRIFDEDGVRLDAQMKYFRLDGMPTDALHRRPDGTIIEN